MVAEVIKLDSRNQVATELVKRIKDVIYEFSGRVNIAEVFGCIEIATEDLKKELLP